MCIQENFLKELNSLYDKYKEDSIFLKESGKIDESIFAKIRVNICEVFTTLFNVSVKKSQKADQTKEEFLHELAKNYRNFIKNIPASWNVNLEKAKKHDNFEEIHKEEIKFETLKEIVEMFESNYNTAIKEV